MGTPPMTVEQFIYAARGQPKTATALKAKIEMLQAEIAKLEALVTDHQAEFRTALVERNRAEQLMAELLRMTADLMSARDAAIRLEGELTDLRSLRSSRPWWCRMLTG
jgi:predicted RNase H-like nuclease (RuvC/YqgF family)